MLEETFIDAVHQSFSAISQKYNLKEALLCGDNIVCYENTKIILEICFDSRRSYELQVIISNKQSKSPNYWDKNFNLGFILKIRANSSEKIEGMFQTSNPVFIQEVVKKLACLTETYAADLLEGNQDSFYELGILQAIETRKYNLKQKLRHAARTVEKAWTSKDYASVVEAYKPLENDLTPVEKKKLQYSEKMVKK